MSARRRRVTAVVRIAPAKLNLSLAVVARRPDGFHALHSVMAALDLADRLVLGPAPGPDDRLDVVGADDAPPPDLGPLADNLVLRGIALARRVAQEHGAAGPLPALAARLEKRIPTAAGLGGGSSDGVAAFEGALAAWGLGGEIPGPDRLAAVAALGSDCPFFVTAGWALVQGRGERVDPLPAPRGGPLGAVVVAPAVAVPSRAAYSRYAAGVRPSGGAAHASSAHLAGELAAGLSGARLLERAGILSVANDLVPATADLVPGLAGARRALARLLGRPVGQSGSGPALWCLAESRAAAEEDAGRVRAALADGGLDLPGERPAFVAAAALAGPPETP